MIPQGLGLPLWEKKSVSQLKAFLISAELRKTGQNSLRGAGLRQNVRRRRRYSCWAGREKAENRGLSTLNEERNSHVSKCVGGEQEGNCLNDQANNLGELPSHRSQLGCQQAPTCQIQLWLMRIH